MTPRLYMVDVFAEQRYAGNPLAVVVGADALSEDTMQKLAAEMNFSETVYVAPQPEADGGYRVRIFTPAREIAFAGHPILGTAWVLRHHLCAGLPAQVRLNLAVGQVPVSFESRPEGGEAAWFLAPPISLGPTRPPQAIAAALGLGTQDLEPAAPPQLVSGGVSALIVPVRTLAALTRCRPDAAAFAALAAAACPPLVYLYCRQTHRPDNDLRARFFFEAQGVREDPATGNGAAFLGAYLLEHGLFGSGALSLRIEQGYEVGRPSLIMLRAEVRQGRPEISVGGCVVPTVRGELVMP